MNEVIQVELAEDADQQRPVAFTWDGRRYAVHHHGRQWHEDGEHHFLVMTADRRPFELVHSEALGGWRLRKSPTDFGGRPAAS